MSPSDPLSVLEDTQPDSEAEGKAGKAGKGAKGSKGSKGDKEPARHPFFISTPRNLENLLAAELKSLGIADAKPTYLGVDAQLSREEVYRVVYSSRLASRVLRPLASFACHDPDELYDQAVKFNWGRILKEGQTLKVSASVSDSAITHSQYAALKLKDAVVDSLRERTGARPSIDKETPDVRLNLFLRKDLATISLYYSDGIMHRRGYRIQTVEAPLKENLAAAVLLFAGWKGQTPLIDLFCGSGTFLIEAAMIATETPGGYFRETQGFETLPDFSEELWLKVKTEIDKRIKPLPKGLITGVDISARAMAATRANLAKTRYAEAIKLVQKDFFKLEGPLTGRTIVGNPPYGVRLEDSKEHLIELYKSLGQFLKTKCPESKAYVMVPEPELENQIWFKPERRLMLDNGALEVAVAEYSILPIQPDRPDKAGTETGTESEGPSDPDTKPKAKSPRGK